jgi:uncharacterized protein (TIGR00255 family)
MTGYAFREKHTDTYDAAIEVKSYNSRYLDISVFLPPLLNAFENNVRTAVVRYCKRGKVDVNVKLKQKDTPVLLTLNKNAWKAWLDIAKEAGISEKPDLVTLSNLDGVVERNVDARVSEDLILEMRALLNNTLEAFAEERQREGKHTEANILEHLGEIESQVEDIKKRQSLIDFETKEHFLQRYNEMKKGITGPATSAEELIIYQELAVLLVKYSIAEELSRLQSHLDEFRAETLRNPSPGKKLDFLCQEINREVNTIGSKTPDMDTSRAVVSLKDALENIREQLRNVE